MKLYLVRHGETDWNTLSRIQGNTDTVLNEKGRQQAAELADKLKEGYQIRRIYTSDRRRARDTAGIIGERLGITPKVENGLEEINFGRWEGCTWQQVKEKFPEEYQIWHRNRRYHVPPSGESYQQLLERLLPTIDDIINENEQEEEDLLVVTHSAVIMTLMSYLYDTPFEDMAKNYRTGNTGIVELDQKLFYQRYQEMMKENK